MANYKELEGFGVQTLATDPDSAGWIGSIFYNSTEGVFKTVKPGGAPIGTWSSGGNLNTTRGSNFGFGASSTSALTAGGAEPVSSANTVTETYNGTAWTEVNDLNTGAQVAGSFGTLTAGIKASGNGSPGAFITSVESWDGTNWTEVNELNTSRGYGRSCGTQTAGLYFGGYQLPGSPPANNARADNESWNGTSWTELSDLSVARSSAASAINSPSTDTLVAGGDTWGPSPSPANATVETWNGTAWASGTNFNTARRAVMGAGDSSTSVLIYGGLGPPTGNASTEFWNGSSWTEVNDLATARSWANCNGTSPNALIAGGESPGYYNVTEEWTAPDVVIKTVTTS